MQMPREEEVPDMKAPVFDLLPEVVQVEEGETAKFMVKVSGNPRPRVTWWLNGTIVVNVSPANVWNFVCSWIDSSVDVNIKIEHSTPKTTVNNSLI